MPDDERFTDNKLIFFKEGSGSVFSPDFSEKATIQISQLSSGRNIVDLDLDVTSEPSFKHFLKAKTREDLQININDDIKLLLHESIVLQTSHSSSDYHVSQTLEVTKIDINYNDIEEFDQIKFGLVNLINDLDFELDVTKLNDHYNFTKLASIKFEKIEDYDNQVKLLKRIKLIAHTSMISLKVSNDIDLEIVYEIVDDICSLLSVAQGRKIEYIFYEFYKNNVLSKRTNVERSTLEYGRKHVIDEESCEIKPFLESCYSRFVELKKDRIIDRGIIDVLCQAKIRSSLLEIKGLLLTTFVEILKTNIRTYIETKPTKQLTIDFLKWIKTTKEKNKKLDKIEFSFFIEFICIFSKMKDDQPERKEFVNQRNSLTHEGKFCDSQKIGYQYGKNNSKEKLSRYLFVENFINKLILGLLNYKGNFMERSYDNSTYNEQNVSFTNFLNP